MTRDVATNDNNRLLSKKSAAARMHLRHFLLQGLAIALIYPYSPAHSNNWINCKFNGISELCSLAGGSKDFVVTYKSDGKQIRMERVGDDYSCLTGDATCGKMLITEIKERRTTWASFRMSEGVIRVNSSRGNKYEFKY